MSNVQKQQRESIKSRQDRLKLGSLVGLGSVLADTGGANDRSSDLCEQVACGSSAPSIGALPFRRVAATRSHRPQPIALVSARKHRISSCQNPRAQELVSDKLFSASFSRGGVEMCDSSSCFML